MHSRLLLPSAGRTAAASSPATSRARPRSEGTNRRLALSASAAEYHHRHRGAGFNLALGRDHAHARASGDLGRARLGRDRAHDQARTPRHARWSRNTARQRPDSSPAWRIASRVRFGRGDPGIVGNRKSDSRVQHISTRSHPHSQLPPAKRSSSTIRLIPLPSSFTCDPFIDSVHRALLRRASVPPA